MSDIRLVRKDENDLPEGILKKLEFSSLDLFEPYVDERIIAIDDELINYRYNRPGSVQTYRANHTIDIIRAFLFIKEFLISKNLSEKKH